MERKVFDLDENGNVIDRSYRNPMKEIRERFRESAIADIIWQMDRWDISLEDIEKRMSDEC